MRTELNKIGGRIGAIAAAILALAALGLYLYSERAVPPETEFSGQSKAESAPEPVRPGPSGSAPSAEAPTDAATGTPEEVVAGAPDPGEAVPGAQPQLPEPEISLERQQRQLREDLSVRLAPGQIEMIVDERLLERLVTTVNSLDGAPVPLRFRPVAHVPGLPRLVRDGDVWQLSVTPDPRYGPYRALFDRLGAVELAELFDRYEPALEKAWQALGEHSEQTFRGRVIEILEHLVDFEPPAGRPRLHQPKVLYEYIDPSLEQLSWGRKILVRIGPEHASSVQRKLAALAERLAKQAGRPVGRASEVPIE